MRDGNNDLQETEILGLRNVAANNQKTGMTCTGTCASPAKFLGVVDVNNYLVKSECTGNIYTVPVELTPIPKPCDKPMVGNPCSAATGNKYQAEMDYPGSGGPLKLVRYYNAYALREPHSATGSVWRTNYSKYLYFNDDAILPTPFAQLWRPDGDVLMFIRVNGVWQAEFGDLGELTQTGTGWEFRLTGYSVERYDTEGRFVSETDNQGRTITLVYNALNFVETVTDDTGRQLSFTYNPTALVMTTMTDPDGRLYSYEFNSNGNLTKVTYPDPKTRRYHYENTSFRNALTGITDENNVRFASWTYDIKGRVASSEHAGGTEHVALAYNANGTTSVTDQGGTTTYSFQVVKGSVKPVAASGHGCASCGTGASAFSYDANGNLASKTDLNGNVTTYVHNARGLEESRTEAYGTPLARTITNQWHSTYRLPTQIDEPGRRTTYTYDGSGNRLSETVTDTATGESRTTTWTYTGQGRVDTVNGARTDVADITDYDYDAQGNLITITNALSHITEIPERDAYGNPTKVVDANGVIRTLTYDARQRLKTRTVAGATTSFDYDGVGQLTKVTQPGGSFLNYTYDAARRLTDVEDNLGNRVHYTLDALGNRVGEQIFDSDGALKRTQSNVFDALGRLKEAHGANGQVTSFEYDAIGNVISETKAGTLSALKQYDALNRLTEVNDPATGETQYQYDGLDRLVSIRDPESLTTTYVRNAFGDVVRLESPDTGITVQTFDRAGNVSSKVDERGITTRYTYDVLNRVTSETHEPGVYYDQTVAYYYDGSNYTSSIPNGIGRLTGFSRAGDDVAGSFVYDARGEVTEDWRLPGHAAPWVVTRYVYDAAGRLSELMYPSSGSFQYQRDPVGRITSISSAGQPYVHSVRYLPFGPVLGWTMGNGIEVTRTYDQDYRLISHADAGILDRTLSYNDLDSVTGVVDRLDPSRSQVFGYDPLQRLVRAEGSYGAIDYTYDDVGNRLTEVAASGASTYHYAANTHHLLSVSGVRTADYGGYVAGNPSREGQLNVVHNAANRLYSVDGAAATYYYDVLGRRTQKQVRKPTATNANNRIYTNFHYDLAGRLLAESDYNSQWIRGYVYLDDIPVVLWGRRKPAVDTSQGGSAGNTADQLLGTAFGLSGAVPSTPQNPQPEYFYIHTDHLGTPLKLTDANREVAWDVDYEPFGTTRFRTELVINPLRFPGQYFDAETGLHQNWHRDYDPSIGRYLQSDPLGLKAGVATYAYVLSNPVRYVDPTGLEPPTTACDGRGGFEIFLNDAKGKCDEQCSRAHEEQHVRDFQLFRPDSCRNRRRGEQPNLFPGNPEDWAFYRQTECNGHRVGLKCREQMKENACFTGDCEQRLNEAIRSGKGQVRQFCGVPM